MSPPEFVDEESVYSMTLAPEQLTSIENELLESAEKAILQIKLINESIGKIIFGQEEVIEQVLVTVLSGGHGLLVGLPGLAKTKLVETLGVTLGLAQQRIQFTPDLMPADIIGSEILEETPDKSRVFRFIKGPIFGQLSSCVFGGMLKLKPSLNLGLPVPFTLCPTTALFLAMNSCPVITSCWPSK